MRLDDFSPRGDAAGVVAGGVLMAAALLALLLLIGDGAQLFPELLHGFGLRIRRESVQQPGGVVQSAQGVFF